MRQPPEKVLERLMLRLLGEAEAGENARGPRRRAMGIDGVEPLVDLGDAMRVHGVIGLGEQRLALGVRRQHRLERGRRPARRLLRHIADANPRRRLDLAVVRLVDPGDELEQRRFARAVAPDQPDARLRRQGGGRLVEDEMAAEAQGDGIEGQHGRRDSTGNRAAVET